MIFGHQIEMGVMNSCNNNYAPYSESKLKSLREERERSKILSSACWDAVHGCTRRGKFDVALAGVRTAIDEHVNYTSIAYDLYIEGQIRQLAGRMTVREMHVFGKSDGYG